MMAGSPLDDFLALCRASYILNGLGKERIELLVEDLVPDCLRKILWVGRVYGRSLPDHTVKVDGNVGEDTSADRFLENDHEFLGPANGKHGEKDLALPLDGMSYDAYGVAL